MFHTTVGSKQQQEWFKSSHQTTSLLSTLYTKFPGETLQPEIQSN